MPCIADREYICKLGVRDPGCRTLGHQDYPHLRCAASPTIIMSATPSPTSTCSELWAEQSLVPAKPTTRCSKCAKYGNERGMKRCHDCKLVIYCVSCVCKAVWRRRKTYMCMGWQVPEMPESAPGTASLDLQAYATLESSDTGGVGPEVYRQEVRVV